MIVILEPRPCFVKMYMEDIIKCPVKIKGDWWHEEWKEKDTI